MEKIHMSSVQKGLGLISYNTVWTRLRYPVHTCRGCIGVAPLILHLSTRWMWVVSSYPICFTCRKEHQYPFSRRLGGPQS